MTVFVVIASVMYEVGYEIVGARFSRGAAEALTKAAEEGRFPPSAWASEFAREHYSFRDAEQMYYEIEEIPVE